MYNHRMERLLSAQKISKSFGSLPVIQRVDLDIYPGEIVGLTGSIGSGKSVLAMILAGLYAPDEGRIIFNGKPLQWPFSAKALGIGVIHQRPSLDDQSDIVSNIFLGNEIGLPTWLGALKILNKQKMEQEAQRILAQLGVEVHSIHERTVNLSGEVRQMVAIARALTAPFRLIIIDEPTVLLSYPNQQRLLGLIQNWRQQGVAVLFSSSILDHLFAVTDRIIILNQGRKVADYRTDETTRETVASLLLGPVDPQRSIPSLWEYDQYGRIREQTEKLVYHQMLLEKEVTSEPTLNRQLTEQLAEQVQALDQINLALIESHRRLLSEREQERKHLARELHDQVIQDLLSVNYDLEGMETEQGVAPPMANDLAEVRQAIRDLVDNLRQICGELRPPTIDSLGLGAALQSHTRQWSSRTGIKAVLNLDSSLGRLPEAIELSVFRIVQEGLNNVWRHARATQVTIDLRHTSPRTLMVSIQDDGQGLAEGFDLNSMAAQGHYGLVGISERVALLGGRFQLQRRESGGTLLMVDIPHPRVASNSEIPS